MILEYMTSTAGVELRLGLHRTFAPDGEEQDLLLRVLALRL
jgi:hypothetical protein